MSISHNPVIVMKTLVSVIAASEPQSRELCVDCKGSRIKPGMTGRGGFHNNDGDEGSHKRWVQQV